MAGKGGTEATAEVLAAAANQLQEDDDDDNQLERLAGGHKQSDASKRPADEQNVRVMVRCRPPLKGTPAPNEPADVLAIDEQTRSIELRAPDRRRFHFDRVFGPAADDDQVYLHSASSLVEFAFQGYNCTLFLYGQTGTGKTYTHSHLTRRSFDHLFSVIAGGAKQDNFLLRASYYELYNEDIFDLLAPPAAGKQSKGARARRPLELRESKSAGVYIKELSCYLVSSAAELTRLKQLGDRRRSTGATKMNEHSSRAHSIFSITIESIAASRQSCSQRQQPVQSVRVGRLHLIDLAGSERQAKSESRGLRLKEASRINLSLTCLALVIRALTDNTTSHIPYRNSKLTRLLSGSLGGNSRTLLIACVAPERANLDETLNTLRFASRTKQVKNQPVVNEDPKDALLRNYRAQIDQLRQQLERRTRANSGQEPAAQDQADEQQQPERRRMFEQLKMLRDKIMVGGENLLDKWELHERLLETSRAELEEKQREEAKLNEHLAMKRRQLEQVQLSKGNLGLELQRLDGKLEKSMALLERSRVELRDLASEHEQLKDDLLLGIRATSKEIEFANCIIHDFVPRDSLDLINTCAQWDEQSDEWQIRYIALSGNNCLHTKRLITDHNHHQRPHSVGISSPRDKELPGRANR